MQLRKRLRAPWLEPGFVLALALVAGCSNAAENVPPATAFYFPTGVAIDPSGAYAYITNGNSDLRYSGGTVNVVDLAKTEATLGTYQRGTIPPGCAPSPLNKGELDCDATSYFVAGAAVEIGNFAGNVVVQNLIGAPNGLSRRLFFPVRGDPSLTYVDVLMKGGAITGLQCTASPASGTALARCDGNHRLDHFANRPSVALPDEPFGIAVDGTLGYVYLSHQVGGYVTLALAPPSGAAPTLVDSRNGLVGVDSNGQQEAFGLAIQHPGDPSGLVYVTSRSTATYGAFRVGDDAILPVLSDVIVTALRIGANVRGVSFADGGNTMLLLDNEPSSLLVYDSTLQPSGLPRNQVLGEIQVCGDPSFVVPAESSNGLRAYVVCFQQSQVWDVDVDSQRVLSQIAVGSGPNAMALAPPGGPMRAYVANFSENSLAVIDVDPTSPTFDTVVLKLGPRPVDAAPGGQ
jgi:DNA-binding beta-propeller fold protein YncE